MEFILQEVRYAVNRESVAIAVRPNSPRITSVIDLYTTQTALQERAIASGSPIWSDDEVIAEAQEQLAVTGDTMVLETAARIAGEPPLIVAVGALEAEATDDVVSAADVAVAPPK